MCNVPRNEEKPKRTETGRAEDNKCRWEGCNVTLRTAAGRTQHEIRVHRERPLKFECHKCHLVLSEKSYLTNHLKICEGQERGQCPKCGKEHPSKNMARHRKYCKGGRKPTATDEKEKERNNTNPTNVAPQMKPRGECPDCGKPMLIGNISRHRKEACPFRSQHPGPSGT